MMQWKEFKSHISHLSSKDQQRIGTAFEMGEKAHDGQKRKSGEPYFTHPIAVAHILADLGADADTLIAALLHDTVEDTDLTLPEIDKAFNGEVATLIDGVTKIYREDLDGRPTLDDQIETLRKIFKLMQQDVRIMVIKLVDRLHNMQTVEYMKPARQITFAQETMDVFVKIADRLSMHDLRNELESLCLSVLEPKGFEKMSQLRIDNERIADSVIRGINTNLVNVLGTKHVDMFHEPKSWHKLRISMESGEKGITGLARVTCAFVCDNIHDCYQVLGSLHQLWQREHLSFQDYINDPVINGYRGLHTTIILEDGTRVRCKIRTQQMHEYHKYGVMVSCFDSEAMGLFDYLPWVERIAPLTEDAVDRSTDFFESLQSDILGESIMVHGMNDHTEMMPEGATALDGVFYCFRDEAYKMRSIRINGEEVAPQTPLRNGVSLDVSFAKHKTLDRKWLEWVNTGLATAMIRSKLARESENKKLVIGKELLQDIMTEQGEGFIEEYDEEKLKTHLANIGYLTVRDAYIAIADGKITPVAVYTALFKPEKTKRSHRKKGCAIRFNLPVEDLDVLSRVISLYKKYSISLHDVRLRPSSSNTMAATINIPLRPAEEKSIAKDLSIAGASNISVGTANKTFFFFLGNAVLLLIWGFDPAIAYRLINEYNIPTVDMVLVRFWTLTAVNGLMLLWHRYTHQIPKTRLPIANMSLWGSALLMMSVAFCGYKALQGTIPAHYSIPMTAGGVLLTSIVHRKRWGILTLTWSLLIGGTALIALYTPHWSLESFLYMMAAVASFSAFSIVSERYKRKENVGARSTQYFFLMSLLCTIITLPFVTISHISLLPAHVLVQMIFFSIFFAGLPYYMYYFLLSHKQIDFVLRYSYMIIYSTILGQILFSGIGKTISPVTVLSALIVTLGAMLPMVTKKESEV